MIVMPCQDAPDWWQPIADDPQYCTYLVTLEFWIRESIEVDDRNRETLGR